MRFLLTLLCLAAVSPAAAQTLTVVSSNATNELIHELAPRFEKASGYKLFVKFDNSAALKARIERGEAFDVAVLSAPVLGALAGGMLAADSRKDIARAGVGMAIHPQGTKPDISTLDALKGALITARSITYVEQGATAPVMQAIFAKLGLTELMNAKTTYSDNAAQAVAEKKAELGFTQISEILNVPGARFAAPLPPEVQVYTTFAAAARPNAPAAAKQFIALLTSAEAAPIIKKVGLEPIPADRMPPIAADRLTPAQRGAIEAFRTARSVDLSGPFHPLLRSPELMTRARAMGDYLRYKSSLPPRLSEFVILMTSRRWTQQYEWNAHYAIALKAGVKPEIANAIAEGKRPAQMSEEEAILFDFCQELDQTKFVSDMTYTKAVKAFGEQGVIDAIGITGYYTLLAMVLNTARTPAGDTVGPLLRPLR